MSEDGVKAVEVRGLEYSYRGRGPERMVLKGLSFEVSPGEIYGLLGPNGCGKTTTFHILSTAFAVPPGRVSIFGKDPGPEADGVRRLIGVVFQSPSLDKNLTVAENLRHQGHLYGLSGAELDGRIARELSRMRITDRAGDLVKNLSGGLARRAELAKGLLHRPRLVILDEPSTGLDPGARRDLWNALGELRDAGTAVLLTTHWMEEAERCDRLSILADGRVVISGTPDEIKSAVGGDIITLETSVPADLAREIKERFGGEPGVVDGTVRWETENGPASVPRLAEAFGARVRSIKSSKPTLEDVFIRETGHHFHPSEGDA